MIGRVYKLKCGDKFYIGSTIRVLNARLSGHKTEAKRKPRKCHAYFNEYGWDNVIIELLEEGEFENRKALYRREGEYILPYINDENCLNIKVAGRTHVESNKARKEELKVYDQAYHKAHKAEINARKKAWSETHKEERKAYYQANKEKINAQTRARRAAKNNVYKFLD